MDKNNKQSFTLIEILIVATITVLLSGFSVVILFLYKDDKALTTQVDHFMQALALAKGKALAGDTGLCSDSANAYVSGYSVVVNPTVIRVLPNCNTTPTPIIFNLEPNTVFITPTFAVQYDSQKYTGSTVLIPIKQTSTNKCKFVQIDETGLVTNGDYTCP